MFGLSPLVAAVVAALGAFLLSHWWFGVHRRRKAETSAGIAALAGMKWRECAGLVLQAMGEKGYVEAPSSRQPGDGGTEFLLVKGDERCLLSYKHGTAYRLGEANVRDFANAVQLQGATSGVLVTLGSAEGFARDLARRYDVDLIDGRSLWPQVEPFAPAALIEDIRAHAARQISHGQRIGGILSLALGLVVFGLGSALQPAGAPEPPVVAAPAAPTPAAPTASVPAAGAEAPATATAPAPPVEAPAPAAPASPQFQDEASRAANAALEELAEVAKLTDQERTQRRLVAASRVADLETANNAIWSTQSTLVISMVSGDGIDKGIVNDACAILTEYEELRYSRLQLEPPAGENVPVRWRQCQ
ncbi:restriction endonuclease [Arenimonas terrae]|jgi:restriction system protein|uniref:Restriction endonuclease n=1 Tax=Arenimonas terrae TaxID=2546226 RepID=A0A5C4RUJ1_9GAMM|nr:restriction endonuclease [Arenimonas terrae]TNJ34609.1 restriction endonuclease [Arenimonas terrae]